MTAWRMVIVSRWEAKFVKLMVLTPKRPVSGPNVLNIDDENVIV
jgi:hypothetical protein